MGDEGRRGALAAAVNHAVLLRACPESLAIPEGWVVRHRDVPLVQHLNTIRLREPPAPERLIELAEHWQADLPHRRVAIEDGPGGEAPAEALAARGWFRERVVLMTLALAEAVVAEDPRAREIDEAELRALELEIFTEANVGPSADPRLPAQLSDAQALLRGAGECARFAAGEPEQLAAMATLFLDPDVDGARIAQLETVGTRHAHRGQGLANATVGAAIAAARSWEAELIVVVADADDWPQVWYAGLGFATVARQLAYVQLGSGGAAQ